MLVLLNEFVTVRNVIIVCLSVLVVENGTDQIQVLDVVVGYVLVYITLVGAVAMIVSENVRVSSSVVVEEHQVQVIVVEADVNNCVVVSELVVQ